MVTSYVTSNLSPFAALSVSRPSSNPSIFLRLHTPKNHTFRKLLNKNGLRTLWKNMGVWGGIDITLARKFGAMGGAGFFGERKPRFGDVANAFQRLLHLRVLGFQFLG